MELQYKFRLEQTELRAFLFFVVSGLITCFCYSLSIKKVKATTAIRLQFPRNRAKAAEEREKRQKQSDAKKLLQPPQDLDVVEVLPVDNEVDSCGHSTTTTSSSQFANVFP